MRRVSFLATRSDLGRFAMVDAALLSRKAADVAGNARQAGTAGRPRRAVTPPQAAAFVLLSGSVGDLVLGAAAGPVPRAVCCSTGSGAP